VKKLLTVVLLAAALALAFGALRERSPRAGPAAVPPVSTSVRAESGESGLVAPESEPARTEPREEPAPADATAASGTPPERAPGGDGTLFHARIVDGLSGAPVAAARVLPLEGRDFEALSDSAGRFAVPAPTRRVAVGRVLAEGYGEGRFVLDRDHLQPAVAAEIELLTAAVLEVEVTDGTGVPRANVRVQLVWPGETILQGGGAMFPGELGRWECATGEDGRARLEQLAAETELVWNVLGEEGDGRTGRLALAPGEERVLPVALGGGARLFGHVRSEDGRPVAGVVLALTRAEGESDARVGVGKAQSDANGRFELGDVAFGSYVLSPAPGEEGLVAGDRSPFPVDRPLVEHDIVVAPGLFLEGRVVGDPERAARIAFVEARELAGSEVLDDMQPEGGAFRIGPCPAGEYEIFAWDGGSLSTRVVRAPAGATDIELALEDPCTLRIRIVGAEGPYDVVWVDGERGFANWWTQADPVLEHEVAPGVQTVLVRTRDDRVAWLPRVLAGGHAATNEPVLRPEPGARCTVVHRATSGTRSLRLTLDGEVLPEMLFVAMGSTAELLAGASRTVLLPSGTLVAELLEGARVAARETVQLRAGERCRVVLEPR